jgi:hypothetical protein
MRRGALFAVVAIVPAALSTPSLAYEIKPKASETAFGKLRPDVLGISTDATAESARTVFEQAFKGHNETKTDIRQQKFGGTSISYISALDFKLPSAEKRNGEALWTSFTSPASANRAYYVARNMTFAQDQQPPKADMVKQVMDKYGAPTIVGDQHLYYIYRGGKIVPTSVKYKEASALDALDKPLDPRIAIKLNGPSGQGSCVAGVKRAQALDKSLEAMLSEAKGANCDGALSVQLKPGITPDRVGNAEFTLVDFKRIVSAAAIDGDALAAEKNERLNATPLGTAPKL